MRRVLALAASVMLVAAACGDDDADPPDTTPADTTTTTAPPDDESAWVTCENPESGYTIEHPQDWTTNDGTVIAECSLFDPEPTEIEPGTEIPLDIAVLIVVDPVEAEQAWSEGPGEEELSREEATIDGRDAVRQEIEADGSGFLPQGMRTTRWVVDLDDRSLIASTYDTGEPPYDEVVEVLDEMIETLTVGEPTGPTTTTTAPEDEGPDPIGEPGTGAVESEDFPAGFGDTALLVDVREARHEGFHRIVLELEGDQAPSYRASYGDRPVAHPASGEEIEVGGSHVLELILEPAARADLTDPDAPMSYDGSDRFDLDGGAAVELVFVSDFETNMSWVIGVDGRVPFSATMLEDPVRLVVDVIDE
jgi:hypothetical protein